MVGVVVRNFIGDKTDATEKVIRKLTTCDSGHYVLVLSFVGEP